MWRDRKKKAKEKGESERKRMTSNAGVTQRDMKNKEQRMRGTDKKSYVADGRLVTEGRRNLIQTQISKEKQTKRNHYAPNTRLKDIHSKM